MLATAASGGEVPTGPVLGATSVATQVPASIPVRSFPPVPVPAARLIVISAGVAAVITTEP